MITARRAYAATMAAMVAGAAAMAQPVQWRVQDGGNGHWYDTSRVGLHWSDARVHAEALGGYLATTTSAAELAAIRPLLTAAGGTNDFFLGGFRPSNTSPWRWVTGEAWAFSAWEPGAPDNGPESLYLEVIGRPVASNQPNPGYGLWNDETSYAGGGGQRFIIEYSADCNGDGTVDKGQILSGQLADLNSNGIPDGCENPCVFNRQPQAQALQPGGNAAFSIDFARLGQSFQWRRNGVNLVNSSRITGVTTPNLTISAVAAGDQGSYDCVVTGSCGTVTSQAAALSCVPIIMQQPPAEAILVPGASLSVTAPTNASYTYRWRQNGQNLFNIPGVIAGATTRTLTLLSDDSSLVGTYDCVLTNVCGSTTSAATYIPCPADFNLDGGVDGSDVQAFFVDWSAGLGTADLNQDGGVDGGDMFTFFTRWEGGC